MANILHVRDEKTAGTDGGTSSTGDNIRVLNTVVTNSITGASLAANQITLPAGTYDVVGSCPTFDSNNHRAFLYNTSDAAVEVLGHSGNFLATGDAIGGRAMVYGRFTLAAEKVLELRHYTASGTTTNGLGTQTNDARVEVYADLLIQEVV